MEELYQHPDVDILEYPIMERIGHPHREKLLSFAPKTYQNAIEYWLAEKGYHHTYACNKIFRRSLFQNIEFPKGKSFEDVWTIPKLIGLTETEITPDRAVVPPPPLKIRVTDVGKYLYSWNSHGMTSQAKYPRSASAVSATEAGFDEAENSGYKKEDTNGSTEKTKLQMGATEEILLKYQSSLEDFLTQHLNVLLDLYDLSGRYEPDPLPYPRREMAGRKNGDALIQTQTIQYFRLSFIMQNQSSHTQNIQAPLVSFIITTYNMPTEHLEGMHQKHPPALTQCQGKRNHPRG